jgi:3-oxoacyl-[acyl-carrier protein] reductase
MILDGATAIVTGGATGVGAATAIRLAALGCNVGITFSASADSAHQISGHCRSLGSDSFAIQGDVSIDSDCRNVVKQVSDRWGRIDILVNSAGITKFVDHRDLDGIDASDFQRIFAVNVVGAFQMSRAAQPYLKRSRDGAIINVSSISGAIGDGSSIPYAASKGALNTMTLSLARALAPEIRVNAVCPDYISGRWLRDGVGEEAAKKILEDAREKSPLDKVATPDDIAETIVWLAQGARLITGTHIVVDAGIRLGK